MRRVERRARARAWKCPPTVEDPGRGNTPARAVSEAGMGRLAASFALLLGAVTVIAPRAAFAIDTIGSEDDAVTDASHEMELVIGRGHARLQVRRTLRNAKD